MVFHFNENNVCLNPEVVFSFDKNGIGDCNIKVACSKKGKWFFGVSAMLKNQGYSSPCMFDGDHYYSKEVAINAGIYDLYRYLEKITDDKAASVMLKSLPKFNHDKKEIIQLSLF